MIGHKRIVAFTGIAASSGGIGSSDADVAAWLNAGGNLAVTQADANTITTMVTGIKSDLGVSGQTLAQAGFDRFWIHGFCRNATGAQIDLVARSSFVIAGHAPTFTSQAGYTGDAASTYVDTNWMPSTGPNYVQNSASLMVYVQTMDAVNAFHTQAGVDSGAGASKTAINKSSNTQINWGVNNGNITTTTTVGARRYCVERSDANTITLYSNGSSVGSSGATASGAPSASNLAMLANNSNGTIQFFTSSTIAVLYTGKSFGATGVSNIDTRIHTCGNTLNATNFP